MVIFEWGAGEESTPEQGLGWLWPKTIDPPLESEKEAWEEAAAETWGGLGSRACHGWQVGGAPSLGGLRRSRGRRG
eukprot:6178761-Alexandrium_andersonii.AAC.1